MTVTEIPADDLLAHGDPDPYAARDADSFRRAVHQLLARHQVFQQDVVAKAHRFGAQGVTEATAAQLYSLGETLPERKLIEVATGLCGLTPVEQDLWLDAWDRIEYGPTRYALYKRSSDHERYRLPPSPQVERSGERQGRWRTLVAYLYATFGSPPVAGYSAARVEDVLADRVPLDERFLNAMLLACEKSSTTPSAPTGPGAGRMLSDEVKRIVSMSWDNTTPSASAGMLVRTAVNAIEDPEAAGFNLDVTDTLDSRRDAELRAMRTLIERLAARLDTVDAEPGPPRPAPPDPNTAVTTADFVRLMGELRTWSGMSLRALSEAAKAQDDWNLSASSLSDALKKKDKLPRPRLLWALTGAAGLTTAQREQWAAARDRLERDAPDAGQAEPDGDAAEDDTDMAAPDVAEEAPPEPPAVDLPTAELAAQAAVPAGSMYDALMTARQRLLHQCGYQSVCAEGVSEVQAATFTERDAQRDGRVWLPGVASAFGREQLAREVLTHLQRERGRTRRRLREQLVALVGSETVELMEGRLWVPAAEFVAEKERSRRELIEYRVDRMTAAAPAGKRYEYVARYGLLGIASLSPNDVLRHPADIQAVVDVLDSMAAAVDPDRPRWKRLRG